MLKYDETPCHIYELGKSSNLFVDCVRQNFNFIFPRWKVKFSNTIY